MNSNEQQRSDVAIKYSGDKVMPWADIAGRHFYEKLKKEGILRPKVKCSRVIRLMEYYMYEEKYGTFAQMQVSKYLDYLDIRETVKKKDAEFYKYCSLILSERKSKTRSVWLLIKQPMRKKGLSDSQYIARYLERKDKVCELLEESAIIGMAAGFLASGYVYMPELAKSEKLLMAYLDSDDMYQEIGGERYSATLKQADFDSAHRQYEILQATWDKLLIGGVIVLVATLVLLGKLPTSLMWIGFGLGLFCILLSWVIHQLCEYPIRRMRSLNDKKSIWAKRHEGFFADIA